MKLSLLVLAASILVPSLAAVTETTSVDAGNSPFGPQSKTSPSPPHQTTFGRYSLKEMLQVLREPSVRVSPAGTLKQIIRDLFASELRSRSLFEDPFFERHFESKEERDVVLSLVIALELAMAKQAKINGGSSDTSAPVWSTDCIERELGSGRAKSPLIRMLPTLSSSDLKDRLLHMLSGTGAFTNLPLEVRQFIAKDLWEICPCPVRICSLPYFLLSFYASLAGFQDALAKFNSPNAHHALFKIALEIDCKPFSIEERGAALTALNPLVTRDSDLEMVYLFHDNLPPNPSISDIYSMAKSVLDGDQMEILCSILKRSPEHVTAIWFMWKLGKSTFEWDQCVPQQSLLFNGAFLDKHGILQEDRKKILESCSAKDMLQSLPADLASLDLDSLVQWVNDSFEDGAVSPTDLITLYISYDIPNVPYRYAASLIGYNNPLEVAKTALEIKDVQDLIGKERFDLLKRLDPKKLDGFCAALDGGNRRALVVNVVSLLEDYDAKTLVKKGLSDEDFILWMEDILDDLETYRMPGWIGFEREAIAKRMLTDRISNIQATDMDKYRKISLVYRLGMLELAPE